MDMDMDMVEIDEILHKRVPDYGTSQYTFKTTTH